MKLKYFLRGLGAGIVFATLIMLVAYMTSGGYKLTDDEIIEKAEALGMVMEEKEPLPTTSEEAEVDKQDTSTENVTEAATEASTETTTTENDTTEGASTESASTESEVLTEEEPITTTTESDGTYVEATIQVVSGMSSYEIAQLLQEAGIIDDAADFDSYLNKNGYSTQLKINTYTFNSNMTYEEIAEALIKEDAN